MPDPTPSHPRRTASPASGPAASPGFNLTRDDVLFIVFRHKWTIGSFALLGILGSALFYFLQAPVYRSEAKLLVRYVFDAKSNEGVGTEGQIKPTGSGGENIINSELEILTSLDLCKQVATTLGSDKILVRAGVTNQLEAAGAAIKYGLLVEVPRNSSVIKVSLQHRDPEVAVNGLRILVDAYLRRHVEVHRAIGIFDTVLFQQRDQFRTRLAETERKLRDIGTNFVGITIEDARKALTDQLGKIRQDIYTVEADLAGSSAAAARGLRTGSVTNAAASSTNVAATTNAILPTNIVAAEATTTPATINEYRSLCSRLDSLRSHELDLIALYKDENFLVRNVRQQILETEVRKELIEAEYPGLLRMESAVRAPGELPVFGIDGERFRVSSLQGRLAALSNQMAQVKSEIAVLDGIEGEVQSLQRTKEIEKENYRYYAAGIEQARFGEAVAGGKLANISTIQAPTPAFRENTRRSKITLGILMGGILGGLAIAFIIELLLDHSLKRPAQVEDRLHLPLFVSIPRHSRTGVPPVPAGAGNRLLHANSDPTPMGTSDDSPNGSPVVEDGSAEFLADPSLEASQSTTGVPPVPASQNGADVSLGLSYSLRPSIETLRDRVLFHFEGNLRKPKLLGVTGCVHGSGVTTVAVGLAASLSETGGGNVLLVDLNLEDNTVHPFFQGRPGCGLADAVETDRREVGLVSGNLYLAMGRNGAENGSDCLPQRLSLLVPKLRVSDYDYIVFDLPRVTQTGITARLAGMMDLVLMVVESGKDQRDAMERALGLLNASGAKVSGVLNKVQSYVPRRLRSHFYESSTE